MKLDALLDHFGIRKGNISIRMGNIRRKSVAVDNATILATDNIELLVGGGKSIGNATHGCVANNEMHDIDEEYDMNYVGGNLYE